jgi:hypothetical protein
MFLLDLTRLAFCSTLAAPVTPAAPAPILARLAPDTAVVTMTDTVQVTLTTDVLTKMTAFVSQYLKAPKELQDSAGLYRTMMPIPFAPIARLSSFPALPSMNAPDMVTLAAKFPAIAENFKQAGITPHEYMRVRRSLMAAHVHMSANKAVNGDAAPFDTSNVIGKNSAFLKAHPTELQALAAAGMSLPELQVQVQQKPADDASGGLLFPPPSDQPASVPK